MSRLQTLMLGLTILAHALAMLSLANVATAHLQPPDTQPRPTEFIGCLPKPADWDLQVKHVAELRRGETALDLPQGISAEVFADGMRVSWTVSIGSNDRGPARLIDLAKAVGMDDHDRSRVLVAWSDRIAAQLRELTINTLKRTRPDRTFYPETELEIRVAGHPFPSTLAKGDPKREAATRFTRTYRGSDCVGYFNGELNIDEKVPRSAAVGSVATRVTFDTPMWDLSGSKQGTMVLTNTTPNRVRVWRSAFIVMSRDGVEVPFKRNGIMCGLPSHGPPPNLALEPGATGTLPVELVTSTAYGRYELSAGPLAIKVTASCEDGVQVEPSFTSVIAVGEVAAETDPSK